MATVAQPRLPRDRHRERLSATSLDRIAKAVNFSAKKFGVSKSFVISTALADFFGIKEQPDFKSYARERRKN